MDFLENVKQRKTPVVMTLLALSLVVLFVAKPASSLPSQSNGNNPFDLLNDKLTNVIQSEDVLENVRILEEMLAKGEVVDSNSELAEIGKLIVGLNSFDEMAICQGPASAKASRLFDMLEQHYEKPLATIDRVHLNRIIIKILERRLQTCLSGWINEWLDHTGEFQWLNRRMNIMSEQLGSPGLGDLLLMARFAFESERQQVAGESARLAVDKCRLVRTGEEIVETSNEVAVSRLEEYYLKPCGEFIDSRRTAALGQMLEAFRATGGRETVVPNLTEEQLVVLKWVSHFSTCKRLLNSKEATIEQILAHPQT